MYGWTADEVLGRHTLEVAQLDMSYEDRADIRQATAEQGSWRGEVVADRKDGTTVPIELVTVALQDDAGGITGFLGIHRDTSERKRAQEAILERISDAFVAVDREWRYTYVNENALRRMEWTSGRDLTREDVLGQGMWELSPDAVEAEVNDRYHAALREQRPADFETYLAPSDEWIEVHAYPSESGLSVYYRNVSERKRSEHGNRRICELRPAHAAETARLTGDRVAFVGRSPTARCRRQRDEEDGMKTLEEVQTWRGMTVVDADGDRVGTIDDVFLDRQSGEPEWATVKTGLFGIKVSFVPIRDAEVTGEKELRVPYQKEQIKEAPSADPNRELSPEAERRLWEHYGRSDYDEWDGEDRTTTLDLPEERPVRFEPAGDTDGEGAESPTVVGVRLRRCVVVVAATGAPGSAPNDPAARRS
jgi:PAS domain S-box-containing protein